MFWCHRYDRNFSKLRRKIKSRDHNYAPYDYKELDKVDERSTNFTSQLNGANFNGWWHNNF